MEQQQEGDTACSRSSIEKLNSSTNFDNAMEKSAHNIIVFNVERTLEIDQLDKAIEEQNRLMEELRKNHNEILLDTNILEKKILEERSSKDNAALIAQSAMDRLNLIKTQINLTHQNLDVMESYRLRSEAMREAKDIKRAAYMTSTVQAEANCQMLLASAEKARKHANVVRSKIVSELSVQLEKLNLNKTEVEEMVREVVDTTQGDGFDKAWLSRLTCSKTMVETLAHLRKVVSVQAEKNKTLKKRRKIHDEEVRKAKEEIYEIERDTKKINSKMEDIRNQCLTEEESECYARLLDISNKINDMSDTLKQVKENSVAESAELVKLEDHKKSLLELETKLNNDVAVCRNEGKVTKEALETELKEVENAIAKAEQERLLLEGRVLEISQQLKSLSDDLAVKNKKIETLVSEKIIKEQDLKLIRINNSGLLAEGEAAVSRLNARLAELKLNIEENKTKMETLEKERVCVIDTHVTLKKDLEKLLENNTIEEMLLKEQENKIEKLRKESEDLKIACEDIRFVTKQLERHQQMFDKNEAFQKSCKDSYEKTAKEIELSEAQALKNIEEEIKILKTLKETGEQRDDDLKAMQLLLKKKLDICEQLNEETVQLKHLLRDCNASLTKVTDEKEHLIKELAIRRRMREDKEQTKRNEKKQRDDELKRENVKRLKQIEEEENELKKMEEIKEQTKRNEKKQRDEEIKREEVRRLKQIELENELKKMEEEKEQKRKEKIQRDEELKREEAKRLKQIEQENELRKMEEEKEQKRIEKKQRDEELKREEAKRLKRIEQEHELKKMEEEKKQKQIEKKQRDEELKREEAKRLKRIEREHELKKMEEEKEQRRNEKKQRDEELKREEAKRLKRVEQENELKKMEEEKKMKLCEEDSIIRNQNKKEQDAKRLEQMEQEEEIRCEKSRREGEAISLEQNAETTLLEPNKKNNEVMNLEMKQRDRKMFEDWNEKMRKNKQITTKTVQNGDGAETKPNFSWMKFMENEFALKEEKSDETYPTWPASPLTAINLGRNKFFKSRNSDPGKIPIYARSRSQLAAKSALKEFPADVFDYDSDDDIKVVYEGCGPKIQGKSTKGRTHSRKKRK